jgi:hypothetical protein
MFVFLINAISSGDVAKRSLRSLISRSIVMIYQGKQNRVKLREREKDDERRACCIC